MQFYFDKLVNLLHEVKFINFRGIEAANNSSNLYIKLIYIRTESKSEVRLFDPKVKPRANS